MLRTAHRRTVLGRARAGAAVAASALLLAGCTGGNPGASPQPTPPSPSISVKVPTGVELTEPGARLSFGDTATVAYDPGQGSGTVLALTVRSARQGTLRDLSAFDLDKRTRTSTPYYVRVSVENRGPGTVAGGPVPLLGVDGGDLLLPPAVFTTEFRRCPSERLPKSFGPGDSFRTCLVYLSPDKGSLEGVSYRPDPDVAPVTWTGEVGKPAKRGG